MTDYRILFHLGFSPGLRTECKPCTRTHYTTKMLFFSLSIKLYFRALNVNIDHVNITLLLPKLFPKTCQKQCWLSYKSTACANFLLINSCENMSSRSAQLKLHHLDFFKCLSSYLQTPFFTKWLALFFVIFCPQVELMKPPSQKMTFNKYGFSFSIL